MWMSGHMAEDMGRRCRYSLPKPIKTWNRSWLHQRCLDSSLTISLALPSSFLQNNQGSFQLTTNLNNKNLVGQSGCPSNFSPKKLLLNAYQRSFLIPAHSLWSVMSEECQVYWCSNGYFVFCHDLSRSQPSNWARIWLPTAFVNSNKKQGHCGL